jgi:PhnB protein
MAAVKPIPEGQHSVTAALVVKNARKAIEFYKTAFGAKELGVWTGPDGKTVMHSDLKIGDSKIYVMDEMPEMGAVSPQTIGGTAVSLNIYTENCDMVYKRAIGAGATVKMALADQFWGDRYGTLVDPFGHIWGIATHVEDVSREEMEKRMKQSFSATARK